MRGAERGVSIAMTHDDHIGYALDLLDADERIAMEARFAAHPEAAALQESVRAALALLELARDEIVPPSGLATRTIGRLAAELVETEPRTPGEPLAKPSGLEPIRRSVSREGADSRSVGGRFRLDLIVAVGIGLFAVGLGLSFVNRARQSSEVMACQNNLRMLHQGLSGYADTHGGRFPQVGTEAYPTADTFVQALKDAGQCPPGFHAVCPVAARPDSAHAVQPVSYAYSLGHRAPNNAILGQWRSTDSAAENDLIPLSADYPVASAAPGGGPTSGHRYGHNVLFMNGNVRFATVATVGVDGDDIYRNQYGAVAAGVSRVDTVLGRAGDMP